MRRIISILFILIVTGIFVTDAKKIKNSFKVEREPKSVVAGKTAPEGIIISMKDAVPDESTGIGMEKINFAGYEKELSSNYESFIIINGSDACLTGFSLKIDYLDMKGRMIHSREVTESCDVPKGESRKIDIRSWDTQRTYYYYLGNEPRRVATPYKVSFQPICFWIKEPNP